jgi:hypothetical protein
MTTITDAGLNALADIIVRTNPIDEVAVGTATNSESGSATALGAEVHRSTVSNGNVDLLSTSQSASGEAEVAIRVSGGLEVSPGTAIAEIGIFADGTLVFIENIAPVSVASGDREEFVIQIDPLREQL